MYVMAHGPLSVHETKLFVSDWQEGRALRMVMKKTREEEEEDKLFSYGVLGNAGAIAAEAASWNRIVEKCYDGHPFLSVEWFLLWLTHFAPPGVQVCFLKVLRRDEPVAYFPLVLATEKLHGVEVRALRFAGNIYSPISCPIVAAGLRPAVFDFVVREALPKLPWTIFTADDLPLEYVGPPELHVALSNGGYDSYLLPSEGNWTYTRPGMDSKRYLAELDGTLRSRIKKWSKKLGAMGRLELRVVGDGLTPDDVRAYQEVYGRSWKEPEIDETFHPDLMGWAAKQGFLRLFLLTLDNRPIATHLWVMRGRRAYALKFAYDEAYREQSPGNVMMWLALEHLFDVEHIDSFDYVKGDDAYKRHWSSERRQRLSLLSFSPDWRGRAVRLLDRELLPWVRRQPVLDAAKRRAAAWLHA